MRPRSEATGGYDYGWLIAVALGLLAISVGGLAMLAVAIRRQLAGRPSPGLMLGGAVLALPLLVGLALFLIG
ncbi:hypothetical protein [Paracoccus aminovorans]|uniref:hypothetical protein n=1 Tax=Paracoccus aminovorans TaxID=34004 RepID=UPI002B25A483|nr:hypothetical protein [Paracoccus aminovorans]